MASSTALPMAAAISLARRLVGRGRHQRVRCNQLAVTSSQNGHRARGMVGSP